MAPRSGFRMFHPATRDPPMNLELPSVDGWRRFTRRPAQVYLWCALAASGLAQPAAAISQPFKARFSLTTQGAKIGQTEWTVDSVSGGVFVYESRTSAAGIYGLVSDAEIVERSHWRLDRGKLQPLSYSYRRSGGDKEHNVEVSFDWEKNQAENTARGHSWRMPVPDGTLDKLSYVLVLMNDLANEKTQLRYQIADGGRLKLYELRIEGEERISTALGPLDTVIVRRLRNSEDRETLLWCAKSLNYLPVMIEHREKDGTVLWRIESYQLK
jgi:hypothetical protein